VFENRLLRTLIGPKRDDAIGGWRGLHYEEFHVLYPSPSIIRIKESRRVRWAEQVAQLGEKRNAYRLLVGKPEQNRSLGRRSIHRQVYNIKMDLQEIVWG
jgi:hypothetical protein